MQTSSGLKPYLLCIRPSAPVGRHVGAAYDAGQLVQDFQRRGPQEEVEVQDAASHAVLQPGLCDGNVHAIAVQQHDPMRLPICSRSKVVDQTCPDP